MDMNTLKSAVALLEMLNLPQKALSIRQPWAWAIMNAGKNIENRPRNFNYRGPICIHASKSVPPVAYLLACHEVTKITGRNHMPPLLTDDFPRGGIIGTAEIVDCVTASGSPWFFGPFGLVLQNIKPVDFIPIRGALGLFDLRKNLENAHG